MNSATKLESWVQTVRPDGTLRLVRRRHYHFWVDGVLVVGVLALLLSIPLALREREHAHPDGLTIMLCLPISALVLVGVGTLGVILRRRWFREELMLRENSLEHRLIFGRWRRVKRIQGAWVYLEEKEARGSTQSRLYQIRVRGKGGECVLDSRQVYTYSMTDSEATVPTELFDLAEQVAQTTEWHLDIPYLLRRQVGCARG